MTDRDVLAHSFLRQCRRDILDAMCEGDTGRATRAMMARDDFLATNPGYDDGTYRALDRAVPFRDEVVAKMAANGLVDPEFD